MVPQTRMVPTFPYDAQQKLWEICREHALLCGFGFDETVEEKFMNSLSIDEANEAVATASAKLEAFKAQKKASKKRKGKKKSTTRPSFEHGSDGSRNASSIEEKGASGPRRTPGNKDLDVKPDPNEKSSQDDEKSGHSGSKKKRTVSDSSPDPSSSDCSSDNDSDIRKKMSERDKEHIRSRSVKNSP